MKVEFMIVDLHNHTTLCNHATGSMEEYVLQAIQNGRKYFGFSDHAPMNYDQKYRMSFEQMGGYESSVMELKHTYEDSIEILLGYEVDFLPNKMDKRVLEAKVDYLIGSVHFLGSWGFDNPEFIGQYKSRNIDSIWVEYFSAITDMVKSGKFDIVGHIDLIKVFNYLPKRDIKSVVYKTIKAIKRANMVVELNSAGYNKPVKELYPSDDILELLIEENIGLTFSSDAHKACEIGKYDHLLKEKLKEFNITKCVVFRDRDREIINL
jgi:histidinol-phosphatase (PHP family)